MSSKRKYLTLGNILGETFNLYFKNILKTIIPILILTIPIVVLIFGSNKTSNSSEELASDISSILVISSVVIIVTCCLLINVRFIIIRMLSNAYIEVKEKISVIVLESFKRFFPLVGLLIITQLVLNTGFSLILSETSIIRIFGIIVVVIGIILLLGWFSALEVFVIEKKKVKFSLNRSKRLTKGFIGRILLLLCIELVILIVLGIIVAVILYIVLEFLGINSNSIYSEDKLSTMIFLMIFILLYPLHASFKTVVYYNLKKEKECFETEQLADSFLEEANHDSLG
ncbi:MAG: hypothetical protein GY756_25415 [bacterium]|nr:hypothetical protein [bacterium]